MFDTEGSFNLESYYKKDFIGKCYDWRTDAIFWGGVVSAEDLVPENTSDNNIEVTETNYTINGTTTNHIGDWTNIFGGGPGGLGASYSTADSSNNKFYFHGGNITDVLRGGYTYSGNSIGNTLIIYNGNIGTNNAGDIGAIYGGDSYTGNMHRNGFYYEGSFRAGKVKTDFASDNIDKTGAFGRVTYDTSATTLAGHLKIGKAFRLNKNNFLDVYGIYYHAHQNGMSADLSSGEHYNFSSANSGRFRIGYRLTTKVSKISKIYTGLAYQYEH